MTVIDPPPRYVQVICASTSLFNLGQEFRIIRWKTYVYTVVPDQMDGYLKGHHKEISVSVRRQIVEVVKSMEGVARQKDDVVYPPATNG